MDFEENSSCGSPEEKKEIASIIRAKMKKLDLPEEEYGRQTIKVNYSEKYK